MDFVELKEIAPLFIYLCGMEGTPTQFSFSQRRPPLSTTILCWYPSFSRDTGLQGRDQYHGLDLRALRGLDMLTPPLNIQGSSNRMSNFDAGLERSSGFTPGHWLQVPSFRIIADYSNPSTLPIVDGIS